tara:strand:- start:25 stop:465 length:441 start_codon:yes stop_codon:yes gene_type:complete
MNFKQFLLGKEPDFKDRMIQDIWQFTDDEIESNHDFIQLIFPLNKKSQSVFHGYYLDNDELIVELKENNKIKENLIKSSKWFLSFLKRTNHWKSKYDHNQLRITRIIECLRLLVGNDEADNFYHYVLKLCSESRINKNTLGFWKNA